MQKFKVTEGVSYADLFLGLIVGAFVGWGGLHLYQELEGLINPTPPSWVCKKGIAYQETEYGSGIYLKTGQHCVDERFGEEFK